MDLNPEARDHEACVICSFLMKSRVTSSSSTARAECPFGDLGWPTGTFLLPGLKQRKAAGCGPEWVVSAGCCCLRQDRGCNRMELGSSPWAAGQTNLGWPNPPSGSAGLCFGALALAQLLCRDLGGLLLVGPCASFLGCSAGIWGAAFWWERVPCFQAG